MYQEQRPDPRTGFRNFLGIVVFVARTFAVSVEVILHKPDTIGERYLDLQAAAALPLIFFWPAFCGPFHDPMPMFLFTALYVLACMLVRVKTHIRRRRGGPQPHTRYSGTPELMRYTGRMDEVKVKCIVEPLFTFALGGLAMTVSPPLGGYLMIASAGLLISNNVAAECERRRASDMNDAYLEQRRVVDQFRDWRGE